METMQKGLGDRKYVWTALADIHKSFDSLSQKFLIAKMDTYVLNKEY